jgi:hypothetical protein
VVVRSAYSLIQYALLSLNTYCIQPPMHLTI